MTYQLQLFKITTKEQDQIVIYKLQIKTFESFVVDLNSPVSPMPLPEETSKNNLLLKMEGNTMGIKFTFKLSEKLVTVSSATFNKNLKIVNNTGGISQDIDVDKILQAQGSSVTVPINYQDNSFTDTMETLEYLVNNFEYTSIKDSYIIRLINTDTQVIKLNRQGALVSVSSSLDSGSPIVATVNIDFLTGSVLSIYDADTPSQVRNVDVTQIGSPKGIQVKFQLPERSGGTAVNKFVFAFQHISKSEWTTITKLLTETGVSNSGLTYEDGYYYFKTNVLGDNVPPNPILLNEYFVKVAAGNTGGIGISIEKIIRIT